MSRKHEAETWTGEWDSAGESDTPRQTETRERLAAYAHDAWSGWMRHLFASCVEHSDGTRTLPRCAADRWARQCETPYAQLSASEQDSDRAEADRMLAILAAETQESLHHILVAMVEEARAAGRVEGRIEAEQARAVSRQAQTREAP